MFIVNIEVWDHACVGQSVGGLLSLLQAGVGRWDGKEGGRRERGSV